MTIFAILSTLTKIPLITVQILNNTKMAKYKKQTLLFMITEISGFYNPYVLVLINSGGTFKYKGKA